MDMTTGPTEDLGLSTLDAAFDRAASESAFTEADPPLDLTALPTPVEEKQPEVPPTEAEPEVSLFGDLPELPPAKGVVDWDVEVEVKGFDKPVKLGDLRDGGLRMADYTRKTQALAEDRKAFEKDNVNALRLYTALNEDPIGTIAYLAVESNLVDEQTVAGKAKDLKGMWKAPPKPEEIEAIIEQRVAERLQEHPTVKAAAEVAAAQAVEREFADIETKFSVKIPPKDREAVLRRAIREGANNLELVFNAMMAEVSRVRERGESVRQSATLRPGTRGPSDQGKPSQIGSLADAYEAAIQDQAAQA
jgi:hypothetical protein